MLVIDASGIYFENDLRLMLLDFTDKLTLVQVMAWCYPAASHYLNMASADLNALIHLPLDKMAAILADAIFKGIFLNETDKIPIQISLKLVPRSPIDNKSALVQVMAWRRTGDKPLPEPMMTPAVHWRIYAALGGDELRLTEHFALVNSSLLILLLGCYLFGTWRYLKQCWLIHNRIPWTHEICTEIQNISLWHP